MRAARVLVSGFLLSSLLAPLAVAARVDATAPQAVEYVVVYREGARLERSRADVRAAGGVTVREHADLGVAIVRSADPTFAAAAGAQDDLTGAVSNTIVGRAASALWGGSVPPVLPALEASRRFDLEEASPNGATVLTPPQAPVAEGDEPLAGLQWNMALIDATPKGSYAVQPGDRRVKVGIMDTGVDASHPDIAPNFDRELSRNFTTDMPVVDGPCELEADGSCNDPADVDEENGHGTHVAGIVAAARNGLGIAGVAPDVTIVNLRAGQDSGLFFLAATVDALVYAADNGIDVVNMSFFIDPWLFNCRSNPADSPEAREQQATTIDATQRALDYAHAHGVALIAAAGNGNTDLDNPTADAMSPDFPPGSAYPRTIDNDCLTMPTEGGSVIGVSSVGPSTRKAYYSNYGIEQADVAAPGGDRRDFYGTERYDAPDLRILSSYPEQALRFAGLIDAQGDPLPAAAGMVVKDCAGGVCGYYRYLQGTSMAAPHAAGVAALAVSKHGREVDDGLELSADMTDRYLLHSATDIPCPDPAVLDYPDLPDPFTATCTGDEDRNGFYGEGIVNALRILER